MREKLISFEQYTRRKNLIFNQIPKKPQKQCKAIIQLSYFTKLELKQMK